RFAGEGGCETGSVAALEGYVEIARSLVNNRRGGVYHIDHLGIDGAHVAAGIGGGPGAGDGVVVMPCGARIRVLGAIKGGGIGGDRSLASVGESRSSGHRGSHSRTVTALDGRVQGVKGLIDDRSGGVEDVNARG